MSNVIKENTLDLLELMKANECLWKITSPLYKNRDTKNAAYETLLIKLQEVDPRSTLRLCNTHKWLKYICI